VWNFARIHEPRVAAKYRFSAGIVNATEYPIVPTLVIPAPEAKSLAYHVASFVNPLGPRCLKDVAAPYFNMT